MMPIVRWTLWQRRWSLLWWCLGVACLIILTISLYPAFHDQNALNQQLSQLPQAAKSLFSDTGDFFSPQGYLSSQVFYLTLPLLLSVLTIGMGSSLIAREEDDGTLELLLSRSISRGRLLVAKAFSGLIILIIVGAVVVISSVLTAKFAHINIPLLNIAVASLLTINLALLFGSIAMTVTMFGRSARIASIGFTALIAFGGYIVASLAGVARWLVWPAKFSPYHYFSPGDALYGHFGWQNPAGMLAASLILMFIAWLAFRRRDLRG